jgi:hypothetical protein
VRTLILFIIACLILSAGCTNEVAKTTDKGSFHIKLSSTEELLKFGRNEVVVLVTDNKGQGVENAQIEIVPWMPEHRHGAMWPPASIEQGNGLYRSVIALTMTGHWELKITVRKGELADIATFDFPNVKN